MRLDPNHASQMCKRRVWLRWDFWNRRKRRRHLAIGDNHSGNERFLRWAFGGQLQAAPDRQFGCKTGQMGKHFGRKVSENEPLIL